MAQKPQIANLWGNAPPFRKKSAMNELLRQIGEVFRNLFDGDKLMATLAQPEIMLAAFIAINLIILLETGLFVFFLPGDSLLVVTGIVAAGSGWPLHWLILTLCCSAILGDSIGYWIGRRAGPALFQRKRGRLFRPEYLVKAHEFYERHGGKTIILARFVPIVRTFAPVVAGIAKMDYKRFLSYNVFGGIGWVLATVLFGYYAVSLLKAPLQSVFGEQFDITKKIELIALIVINLSLLPIIIPAFRSWLRKRRAKKAQITDAAGFDEPATKVPAPMEGPKI